MQRKCLRLKDYDYSQEGAYFVTVCVKEKRGLLGEIIDGSMRINPAGEMVKYVWENLPKRFPNISMDYFIVMPDHFHGIIIINRRGEPCVRPEPINKYQIRANGTQLGSLGRIIQAFKSQTTHQYINGIKEDAWPPFHQHLWQRDYFERVIRNGSELHQIRQYIINNPINPDC